MWMSFLTHSVHTMHILDASVDGVILIFSVGAMGLISSNGVYLSDNFNNNVLGDLPLTGIPYLSCSSLVIV